MQKTLTGAPQPQPVRTSRFHSRLFSALVISLALGLACSPAPETPTAADNDPDHLFRQMSEKLAQAKTLTFKVDRKLDAALVEGRIIAENAQIEISVSRPNKSVSRPNKFVAKSDSKEDVRHLFFDGQSLSIYDETMKLYATVPVSGTIDEVVAKVNEKYGFTPPLAEFILSDPYRALSQHIKSKSYKGKDSVAGVECHRLMLSGDEADSELWIGTADLLPRKLVATFKGREGNPQLQAEFSNWNLASSLDDRIFAFVAPKDAENIDMVTEAQMQEAAAKEVATPETQKSKTPNAINK